MNCEHCERPATLRHKWSRDGEEVYTVVLCDYHSQRELDMQQDYPLHKLETESVKCPHCKDGVVDLLFSSRPCEHCTGEPLDVEFSDRVPRWNGSKMLNDFQLPELELTIDGATIRGGMFSDIVLRFQNLINFHRLVWCCDPVQGLSEAYASLTTTSGSYDVEATLRGSFTPVIEILEDAAFYASPVYKDCVHKGFNAAKFFYRAGGAYKPAPPGSRMQTDCHITDDLQTEAELLAQRFLEKFGNPAHIGSKPKSYETARSLTCAIIDGPYQFEYTHDVDFERQAVQLSIEFKEQS